MPFLTLSNADIRFAERELTWRTYTVAEALLTTKRVQIIDQKEFATAALDPNKEAFVIHVATLTSKITIYSAGEAQIALLNLEEVLEMVPAEYADYADIFSKDSAAQFLKRIKINEHIINLEERKLQ